MKKIVIFGNSGSGKTTLATKLVNETGLAYLDLDDIAWASPGVRKSTEESLKELNPFMDSPGGWIIEGCYGSLLEETTSTCTEMYFLNPGIEACVRNNISRPWEPHKYASEEAQNHNLEMLQIWVNEYETRTDEYSLSCHRNIFEGFTGEKQEITSLSLS